MQKHEGWSAEDSGVDGMGRHGGWSAEDSGVDGMGVTAKGKLEGRRKCVDETVTRSNN